MDFRGIVAILLLSSLAVQALSPAQKILVQDNVVVSAGDTVVLKFDDIELQNPLGNISSYNGFTFEGFHILDFVQAYKGDLIAPEDIDCAASAPNALVASRVPGQPDPRFMLGSALTDEPDYFKLRSFSVKPIGEVPEHLNVWLEGWEIKDGEATKIYNVFTSTFETGYQEAGRVNLTRWGWWPNGINYVSAYARTWDGRDHWKFCLDDIDIEYV